MSQKRQTAEEDFLIRTVGVTYSSGYELPAHTHDWDQLVYATEGVMAVHTAAGSWVVPSERAVWVPAGVEHRIEMSGTVSMRTLYLRPELAPTLPRECCVVHVSPLLRELIVHALSVGILERRIAEHRRLVGVIVDQLGVLRAVPLALPMPRDRRARSVARQLRDDPGADATLPHLAREAGASPRTIERLFRDEVGMSFRRWRRQLRLLHALRLLADGEPVTSVALRVGYDSPSAFIAMFKKTLGTTPGRYYAP